PAASPVELVLQVGHGDLVRAVAYSPDGRSVATGCADRMVRVWDAQPGAVRWVADARGGSVSSVAFSPDGKTVASGSDDEKVRLWDAATGKLYREVDGRAGHASEGGPGAEAGSIDPFDRTLASGVRVAFSPDGDTLFIA